MNIICFDMLKVNVLKKYDKKVAVFRKEHFNAAHRLFNADWDDATNKKYLANVPCQIITDIIMN